MSPQIRDRARFRDPLGAENSEIEFGNTPVNPWDKIGIHETSRGAAEAAFAVKARPHRIRMQCRSNASALRSSLHDT